MTTRITIQHDDIGDGVVVDEARDDDQIVWKGYGSSRVRGLVRLVDRACQREDPCAPIERDAE